jgi:hypothetical protein
VSFNSNVLTHKLKPLLRKASFDNLKSRWHISLYSESAKAALAKFDSRLKNAPWRLYLVPLPGKACQDDGKGCVNDWIEIR